MTFSPVVEVQRGDSFSKVVFISHLHPAHGRFGKVDPALAAAPFQVRHEPGVLDVEREIGVVVEPRAAFCEARQGAVVTRAGRPKVGGRQFVIAAVETVVLGQFRTSIVEGRAEGVEELRARAPEEPQAEFPRRLSLSVEGRGERPSRLKK